MFPYRSSAAASSALDLLGAVCVGFLFALGIGIVIAALGLGFLMLAGLAQAQGLGPVHSGGYGIGGYSGIAKDLCADNGAVISWSLNALLGASTVASVAANFRKRLPPGLIRFLDVLALNFAAAIKQAASEEQAPADKAPGAIVKMLPLFLALGLAATLAACAGAGTSAGTGTALGVTTIESCQADSTSAQCAKDTAEVQIGEVCNAYGNLLEALAGSTKKPSAALIGAVEDSIPMMQPLCHGPVPADSNAALALAQATLAKLQAAQAANP